MKKVVKMSFETIMSFVTAIVVPLLGFLHKEYSELKKDLQHCRQELSDYKKEVAERYAPREELIRIEDKIDNLTQLVIDRLPKRSSK